jgi:serine/threonine-protein kinase
MTDTLGLDVGEVRSMAWNEANLRDKKPVRVDADTSLFVPGAWEAGAYLNPSRAGYKIALPSKTRFFGRLHFGETRVYGRFTEAHTPTGETLPVCMELTDSRGNVGLEYRAGSEPGKVLVDAVVGLRVVDRFK